MSGKVKLYCLYFLLFMMPAALIAQTPEELIVNIYAEELGYIANNRTEYLDRSVGRSDANREKVLSSISEHGVSLREYVGARSVVSAKPEYNKFLVSHKLNDEEELALFNNYVRALLKEHSSKDLVKEIPDIELNIVRSRVRNKVKAEIQEPVTGGVMWTLSNEMRVICRKTQTKGRFSYSLIIRGGFSDVPGLRMGEGPYVGDMLALYDVAGMKWYDFNHALKIRGIELKCRSSISDLEIYGSAPTAELRTLIVALSSIANDRKINPVAYDYYRATESGNVKEFHPAAFADSLMRPDYRYTSFRHLDRLPGDFPSRVDKYYSSQFSRMNDGVLVLVGDLDLVDTQKTVEQTTGDFKTSKAYSVRPMVQYIMRSGNSRASYTASVPDMRRADVVMSAEMPVTSTGYMALKIVRIELESRLRTMLRNEDVTVRETLEYFPYERVFLAVSCRTSRDTESLSLELEQALESALKMDIDPNSLKSDKSALVTELERIMGTDRGMIDAVRLRYSGGKDYMNGYKGKVAGVKPEEVNAVLEALKNGPSVEIIIK